MKVQLKKDSTSNILQIFIADSSSTTGAGLTGLAHNSAGLTAYYHRDTDTTATAITLVTMTVGTFTSSGFKEIDATNMPGWYQFCPPNAAFATGAASCAFHLKGATNMAPLPIEVELVAYNPQDTVRLGLTALPNAAADAAGGLVISDAGGLDIDDLKADINTIDDFLDTEIAAIKAKTDNLPASPANEATLTTIASYIDTEVAAIKAKTDNLPADPADASDIAASFTTVNTKLDTIDDFLDTEIAALTTNLATANTNINTIDDFLDTEIAAIKAKTDNLPSDPADESSIQAAIAGLNNISAANVLTQVNAALDAASTELSVVPTTTGSLRQFIQFLHAYFRNKKTQTSSTETLYKEDASTSLGTSTLSDNGTTASKGEMN